MDKDLKEAYKYIEENGFIDKHFDFSNVPNLDDSEEFEPNNTNAYIPKQDTLTLTLSKKGQRQFNKVIHRAEKRIKKANKIIQRAMKYLPKGTEIAINTENSDLKTFVSSNDLDLIVTEFKIKK